MTTKADDDDDDDDDDDEIVLADQSISMAGKPLLLSPPSQHISDSNNASGGASIVLFYQYKEPNWTSKQFSQAIKLFLAIGRKYNITGRGRIAQEGVNCTLTASSATGIRQFCQALRDNWTIGNDGDVDGGGDDDDDDTKLFHQTDFKFTDGLSQSQKFKSLSIRKCTELVAYGFDVIDKAPSIQKFGGQHLEATEYHKALQDPDTVVIDVRNNYETSIGTIIPPKGGATLLDPKLRNSKEYPKWLASKEVQQQLHGKKILTFCTGGIRCERATALINQMSTVSKSESTKNNTNSKKDAVKNKNDASTTTTTTFEPKGVYHIRGGIERYLKTYPQGGYWNGKNYLFDKRMEQLPELKSKMDIDNEVQNKLHHAKCCICRKIWSNYRNQYKCHQIQCGVPVLVCDTCHHKNSSYTSNNKLLNLQCELCRQGYRAPQGNPDLIALKNKAEKIHTAQEANIQRLLTSSSDDKKMKNDSNNNNNDSNVCTPSYYPPRKQISDRLFLSRLPLNVTKSMIEDWLQTPIRQHHWLTDPNKGFFYGSCIIRVDVFSKLMLAINKNYRHKPSNHFKIVNINDSNGNIRELLGLFTMASGTDNTPARRQKRKRQQQPKIFRVLAKQTRSTSNNMVNAEVWPPLNHCQTEYPPLGTPTEYNRN